MLNILLFIFPLIALILCQDVCPALPPTSCKVIARPKGEANLRCGVLGKARHPSYVRDPCTAATFQDCREFCLSDSACHSFSFANDQIMAGTCSLYTSSVASQGFRYDNNTGIVFYNRHCYKYNCPKVGCPSQKFNLQVSTRQSPYYKLLVERVEYVLNFTTDVTKATTFHLNQDCQLQSQHRIGSSGVDNSTNPDDVNGPLYVRPASLTLKNNFSIPLCSLDQGDFGLSCNYSAAGGSGSESFYSCNNVVNLGHFPGSLPQGPCGMNEGPISLTAFSFGALGN